MFTTTTLGIISGLLAALAFVPYIISLRKRRTHPHPVTWTIWAITGFVALVTYWGAGARVTIWIAIVNFLSAFVISILSIKYWKFGFNLFDYTCLVLSSISIIVWLILDNSSLALSLSLIADLIAALPTLRKVYKRPKSEHAGTWFILAAATFLSILAIEEWSYSIVVLPLYLCLLSLGIGLLSLRTVSAKHRS